MADAWLEQYIQQKSAENGGPVSTPTPQPTSAPVQKAAPKPVAKPPVNNNPHGKFFSGGLVSKGLDVLRLPEYALASFGKGANDARQSKGTIGQAGFDLNPQHILNKAVAGIKNIPSGVMNRTQFGSEPGDFNSGANFTENKAGQAAINFSNSLAAPSLPVGKIGSVVGKVAPKLPGASKVASGVAKAGEKTMDYIKKTPSVYKTLEQVPGLEHIRNPEAGNILNKAKETANNRVSYLFNVINDTAKKLSADERVQVGQLLEGKHPGGAPAKLVARSNYIKGISDSIGKELIDQGLLSKEAFDKMQANGGYLAHIADVVKNEGKPGVKNMLSFTSDSLKQRKDKLGTEGYPDYIRQFQFPTFKSLSGEIQNVESVKAVKQLAQKFGSKVEGEVAKPFAGPRTTQAGHVLLSDILPGKVGDQFKDVAVPQEVADYIGKNYAKADPNLLQKIGDKALNAWKGGKTVYSGPGYHVRNLLSNQILSDYATGAGLPATLAGYARAVKAYVGKGSPKMNQYIQELKDAGVINRVDIGQGVESLKPEVFGQNKALWKKIVDSPKAFQNASEETAKLNVYSHFRDMGMSVKDAAAKAEEAIFSPYKISQTERNLVKGAVPFYSFTRQAVPLVAKTAVKRGNTLTKYDKAKTAIESLTPDAGPKPADKQNQVRLPIKDKNGNYVYGDPSYIIPQGSFDSENGGQLPFGLGLNPILSEGASQLYNKDLYFDQPIAKSSIPERANAQRLQHVFQTFAPNMVPTDFAGGIPSGQPGINYKTRGGSKLYDAFTNQPDYAGRTRSRVQAVLDTLGLKSSSVNPDQKKFDQKDKSEALKAIQSERRSVLRDKRLSREEKQQIIKQLTEERFKLLHQ